MADDNTYAWQQAADHYGINALLVSGDWEQLRSSCTSDAWPPVYIDENSAIFVRRTPAAEGLIERLKIDCATAPIAPQGVRTYGQWYNAALTLVRLGRYEEGLAAIRHTLALAPRFSGGHLEAGALLELTDDPSAAEAEYRAAAAITPDTGNQMGLAGIYRRQGRTDDEIAALRRAVDLAWGFLPIPQLDWLGDAEMRAGHSAKALEAFDRAIALLPPGGSSNILTRAREAVQRALAEANRPPLPGGLATGLR
jgi:tetratricopeptide (TPR) repeat protein